jgi:hypothetical protein
MNQGDRQSAGPDTAGEDAEVRHAGDYVLEGLLEKDGINVVIVYTRFWAVS